MLGQHSETDLTEIKRQLYEARMLDRFSEKILKILEDHPSIARLTKMKCKKFNYAVHGI